MTFTKVRPRLHIPWTLLGCAAALAVVLGIENTRFSTALQAGQVIGIDIAQRLFLSESTVRNYLSSAIGKTGSRNRIEAVQAPRSNGWL